MKNRIGYTMKLNLIEQKQMQLMVDFFGKDYREVTKLALQQLYIATGQLAKKLTEENETKEEESCEEQPTSESSES